MKIIKFSLILAVLFTQSCESPEYEDFDQDVEGLRNVTVSFPDEKEEYKSKAEGPYGENETITIEIPTGKDEILDLTELQFNASIGNDSKINPPLGEIVDFSQPVSINVFDKNGNSQTNYVKVVSKLPKFSVSKQWFKDAEELGIERSDIPSLTTVGDKLLVADFDEGDPSNPTSGVRVFDAKSGDYENILEAPTSFTRNVYSDDANHFVVNRYNIYGAGFMVYYYESLESSPELILNYSDALGAPEELGDKISVTGNLEEGKAYVYATTEDRNLYYWEFNDGIPKSEVPEVISIGETSEDWLYASVERESIDDTSNLFFSYFIYGEDDEEDLEKGSRFNLFDNNLKNTQLNRENHEYKILDFTVFDINENRILAVLQQGYAVWDPISLKVFDITDNEDLDLEPGKNDYDEFLLYSSEEFSTTNYNSWGSVSVKVLGNEALIFASIASAEKDEAGVMSYKIEKNE